MPFKIRTRPQIPLFNNNKVPRALRYERQALTVIFPDALKYAAQEVADKWRISRTLYYTYLLIEGICRDAGLNLPEGFEPSAEMPIFDEAQVRKLRAQLAPRLTPPSGPKLPATTTVTQAPPRDYSISIPIPADIDPLSVA